MSNSSISSALEYRPKEFADMIGQDAIVRTLSNAIKNENIPQALLFCGPRGVGKTSCARILAKKINNLEDNLEYNIFELDAASNNSVEDIRNITDQIRIPPQVGKYKVYIIDEVHMLSNAAFNAFLKSLEEPPKHVVFILATTEKNKIIPTILSRCQIYDFKKVDSASIIKLLTNICKEKKIKFDENSLRLIAQKSDGSIRDSLSMFDRLVSFTDSNLTISDVSFNLNIIDYETYFELSSLIKLKDIPGILTKYNDIFNRGFDDVNFLTGLSRHLREVLITKLGSSDNISDLKNELELKYLEHSNDFLDEDLILMIQIINDCLINYQKINDKRIHTELCLMRVASLDSIKKKNP
ncbi:MAG: DNA polymerase III subunit gamma/tau [Candidatus Marisimplicoccus sp.]